MVTINFSPNEHNELKRFSFIFETFLHTFRVFKQKSIRKSKISVFQKFLVHPYYLRTTKTWLSVSSLENVEIKMKNVVEIFFVNKTQYIKRF